MQSNVFSHPGVTIEQAAIRRPPAIGTIPERFRGRELEQFDPAVSAAARASLEAARALVGTLDAQGNRGSLVLSGPPGAGKTHLAAGICNAIWAREWGEYQDAISRLDYFEERHPLAPSIPRWANVPSLINRLRGGDEDVRAEARMLGGYPGLVVLDDLGREKVTEWTGETIYVLVNERYERLLSTVVTTNLSVKELADNGYGPAISRLAEDGRLIDMASAIDYRSRR